MTPFMFGYPWLLWAWPRPDGADSQHVRPVGSGRTRRIFGGRQARDQAQDAAGSPDPSAGLAPWAGLLLPPVTEDELITFGRELEPAHDVIGRLLAEC